MKSNKLENDVMQMFLKGDDPILEILRRQYEQASVKDRSYSGVGFFTDFEVPADIPRVDDKPHFQLTDVVGDVRGIDHGVGFVLFMENGCISFLEGFTYGEPWPEEVRDYELTYMTGNNMTSSERNMEWAQSNWPD